MIWAVTLLLPATALLLGAVHPWAYSLLESIALGLLALWLGRLAVGQLALPRGRSNGWHLAAPPGLFVALVALQILPLPPRLLELLSPATYQLYTVSLPGWPGKQSYRWLLEDRDKPDVRFSILPSQAEVSNGIAVPFAHEGRQGEKTTSVTATLESPWRPLLIAPGLTAGALLKALGYFAIGLVLVCYPFGQENGTGREYRVLARVLLASALVLAVLGLIERFTHAGRPLWVFVPYDWGGGLEWGSRAFGTFANPDHYANYLATILPISLAGVLFPDLLGRVRERAAVPLLSATVAIATLSALVATASRGGWVNAGIGSAVLVLIAGRLPERARSPWLERHRHARSLLLTGLFGLIVVGIALTGQANRAGAGNRLGEALSAGSLWSRLVVARQSLAMIRDFPVFGVGLGAWPDLFHRYEPPPWSPIFWNAAHDEYVQLTAETGLLGLFLACWSVVAIVRVVREGWGRLPSGLYPLAAGLIAGLSGTAAQAVFDFPFRIPANALLATVMVAALVRGFWVDSWTPARAIGSPQRGLAGCAAVLSAAMLIAVARQSSVPYPYNLYNLDRLARVDDLRQGLLRHPANSRLHLAALSLFEQKMTAAQQANEARVVLYLEPTNPFARDLYAQALTEQGDWAGASDQISRSVADSPSIYTHVYFAARLIPWLTSGEQAAIIEGFERARAAGYPGSAQSLAYFYEDVGRNREAAQTLAQAAQDTGGAEQKSAFLRQAASDFIAARLPAEAERCLRAAIAAQPRSPDAYRALALDVLVPAGRFDEACTVLANGVSHGANPIPLYLALATVEDGANNPAAAEAALEKAAQLEPSNFEVAGRLGALYFAHGKFDRAALWLKRVSELSPGSAGVFFDLAQAEASAYQYSAAARDYARAVKLAPDNSVYAARYAEFQKQLTQDGTGEKSDRY